MERGQAMSCSTSSTEDELPKMQLDVGKASNLQLASTPLFAKCHLLTLPAELRNKVFGYAVCRTLDLDPRVMLDCGEFATYKALAGTCRQTYHECKALFFEGNEFHFRIIGSAASRINKFVDQPAINDNVEKLKNIVIHVFPAMSSYKVDLSKGRAIYMSANLEGLPASVKKDYSKESLASVECVLGMRIAENEAHILPPSILEKLMRRLREA